MTIEALAQEGPAIGSDKLTRSGPTVETLFSADLKASEYSIEVTYDGSYELEYRALPGEWQLCVEVDGRAVPLACARLGPARRPQRQQSRGRRAAARPPRPRTSRPGTWAWPSPRSQRLACVRPAAGGAESAGRREDG